MNDILNRSILSNTIYDYLIAIGVVLIGFIVIKLFKGPVLRRLQALTDRTNTNIDDYIITSIQRFGIPALYVLLVSSALRYLTISPRLSLVLYYLTIIIITILIIRFISSTVLVLLTKYVRTQSDGEEKVKQLYGIMVIINVFIWSVGILFMLNNLGFNVTAIIASLGIGGIAVALAAQNIVSDIFNYFVIFFDRPFEVGDFVAIDNKSGVIEYVGLKTTRVKTLSGEQLVFSNSDLTGSRIHNFKKMLRRRIVFKIAVTYQTSHSHLKEIPILLKNIVEEQKPITFDRAHFFAYAESSLEFEVVYYVESGDYNLYMDIHQAINLRIYEELEKRNIELAYPTRTLYINKDREDEEKASEGPSLLVGGTGTDEKPSA